MTEVDVTGAALLAPPVAGAVFGERLGAARRFVELLAGPGIQRGVIGPREVERLWDRHMLNSVAVAELIARGGRVLDVGSGAGLPGIPLALARPDLEVALLEPMARRVAWLQEMVDELRLPVTVYRGRAEEPPVRSRCGGRDVVTARAVAPLGRLAGWCLPLLRPGGRLLALKGTSARDEVSRDLADVRAAGGGRIEVVECGVALTEPVTTVVVVSRRGDTVA
ncbi:MAG: 16S rRNA (guanine(527)-N(7))-methyltransferase RsmG [Pseudonocardiaceae bacterium]